MGLGTFFKSVLAKKQDKCLDSEPVDNGHTVDIASMNIAEICNECTHLGIFTVGTGVDLTKRLFDISYFDIDVTEEERIIAMKLLESIIKDTEKALAPNPDGLKAFRNANEGMVDSIRKFGRGSLAWKIEAAGAKGSDVIDIVVEPSSGLMIQTFKEFFSTDDWEKDNMPSILRALILDRRRAGESNATLILAGLVSAPDLVAWNILTPQERKELMSVARDYCGARNVLVNYGLLQNKENVLPFEPRSDSGNLSLYLAYGLKDIEGSPWRDEMATVIDELTPIQKDFIDVALLPIRLKISLDMLKDLYGAEYAENVRGNIIEVLRTSWGEGLSDIFERVELAEAKAIEDNDERIGLDGTVALALWDYYIPVDSNLDEDSKMDIWRTMAKILNIDRVYWMGNLRFLLRYNVNRMQENSENFTLSDEEFEILKAYGSGTHLIHKASIYEDVIGENAS